MTKKQKEIIAKGSIRKCLEILKEEDLGEAGKEVKVSEDLVNKAYKFLNN